MSDISTQPGQQTPAPAAPDAASGKPVSFRGGGFAPKPRKLVGLAVFVVLIALWELGSRSGVISSLVLPAPSEAFGAFMDLANSGNLWRHLSASLQRLVIGFACGVSLGLIFGTAAGLSSVARAAITPLVSAIFPIPKIALLPLFIIWFGIGEGSKVATILFGCFFPMVIATYSAIDNVDRTLIRMGQSFSLSRAQIIWKIVLPAALPGILSGTRIAASISIILLVAAEMIGAEYGIGAYVLLAGNLMATDQLIAGVAILSLLGLTVNWLISRLENHFLGWRN
ncbi:Putative aliphatic sulfonates transport permease protein SsuC [Pseudooceanicola marinus]|uniref:Putative aliphatic sulfonates transport permease protein SsuC n=1 Tax=Pseudooceanicola marinus TaxID=396013 RepID=A0A1X7AA77_9RHOB|nr:ABC transporter permease [Pseudooceanicola marinus]SLN73970.1 Putative aliphatic sulfonates transport permease protein SsuC [Pseudooceanicola marinus]